MSTELAANASIADRVTERIRASFIDLIPEDAFKKMVEREIERFQTHHGGAQNATPLQQMIQEELRKRFYAAMTELLASDEYAHMWDGNRQRAGNAVQQLVKELVPDLVQGMFEGIVQNAVSTLKYGLQQSLQRH